MSTYFQISGLIILMVLAYFYIFQKKINMITEKTFGLIMISSFVCLCLDIMSIYFIERMDKIPLIWIDLVCKLYVASLVTTAFSGLVYLYSDICTGRKDFWKKIRVGLFIWGAGTVAILVAPIEYARNDAGMVTHTMGLSTMITYVTTLILLIQIIYVTVRYSAVMNIRRKISVLTWVGIWMSAAAIQANDGTLLVVGFATSIGVMIIFISLENPESKLDRETGLFNSSLMLQYLRSFIRRQVSFSMLVIRYEKVTAEALTIEERKKCEIEITDFLGNFKDTHAFRSSEHEVTIVCRDEEYMKQLCDSIQKRFVQGWGTMNNILFEETSLLIPDVCVVKNADELLEFTRYAYQHAGKNSQMILLDEKIAEAMTKEKEIEKLLKDAMEKDWIEVFYQPIYSTKKKRFTSAEALVRIRKPEGELVFPGDFIQVAEQKGYIAALGERVFCKVCSFIQSHSMEELGLDYIEVNLSVVQCADSNLAQKYQTIMKEYGVNPKYINLEITESATVEEKQTLLCNMKKLIDFGVTFSLDDFGTGQSNLNYIIEMPVQIVKFDRQMTQAFFNDKKAKYIFEAAMHMIFGMELEIVAEGIELAEEHAMMTELGIQHIQGYYFSKPLSEEDFISFLQ